MIRMCAALIALCSVLTACGIMPPAPIDRYYQLQPTPVASSAKVSPGRIALQTLRADSLYAERPVVFSEAANPRELRQYRYHLWLYEPAQIVQDHLMASLGGVLDLAAGGTAKYRLEGRILRFERVLGGKNGKAAAALELNLSAQGKTVLAKTYRADQAAGDDSFSAFVVAMEQALASIYAEFLRDLDGAGVAAGKQGSSVARSDRG